MTDDRIIITKLERAQEDGRAFWKARASCGGATVNVDDRFGSWHAVTRTGRRDLLPRVTRALEDRAKAAERAEAKAA